MSNSHNTSSSSGIGFVGLLTIAFVVLKLCSIIEWSWWWVLSPVWISVLIAVAIFAVLGAELIDDFVPAAAGGER
jgi:hypothetical protein